uniref:Uncharacterized protein n=1 Tax=Anguilla anguilla TaxID=7936 RepID=A0A0E9U9J6_ANGAN
MVTNRNTSSAHNASTMGKI